MVNHHWWYHCPDAMSSLSRWEIHLECDQQNGTRDCVTKTTKGRKTQRTQTSAKKRLQIPITNFSFWPWFLPFLEVRKRKWKCPFLLSEMVLPVFKAKYKTSEVILNFLSARVCLALKGSPYSWICCGCWKSFWIEVVKSPKIQNESAQLIVAA